MKSGSGNYYWKVVYPWGDHYVSCTAMGDNALHYHIGERTYPRFGKIFIFDSYESAEYFAVSKTLEIFPCEAGGVEPLNQMASNQYNIRGFWNGSLVTTRIPPKGTLGADWVMLLDEDKSDELL